jgi:hypothetical protein
LFTDLTQGFSVWDAGWECGLFSNRIFTNTLSLLDAGGHQSNHLHEEQQKIQLPRKGCLINIKESLSRKE